MYDLIEFVTKTKAGGNKTILPTCIIEHVVKGKLSRALKHVELTEAFYGRFKTDDPSYYDKGSIQIDELWYTDGVLCTYVCLLPCMFGVEDHMVIIKKININNSIGSRMKTCSPSIKKVNFPTQISSIEAQSPSIRTLSVPQHKKTHRHY